MKKTVLIVLRGTGFTPFEWSVHETGSACMNTNYLRNAMKRFTEARTGYALSALTMLFMVLCLTMICCNTKISLGSKNTVLKLAHNLDVNHP
ncbi:MAG: hypothetical protein MUE56_10205, partial [Ignavibacteria bacterium]|nr:hypothetical protein [Ignavibacteria bacterium]